jgi:MFS family permease
MRADFSPLREQSFRRYWTGQSISAFGDGLTLVVTAVAVLTVGGTAVTLGVVMAAGSICRVLSALVAGTIADRSSRRRILIVADSGRFAIQAGIGIAFLLGTRSWLLLLAGASCYGVAAGFFGPVSSSIVPALASKESLQKANALLSLSRSTMLILGPGIAGLLIAASGVGTVYLIDAATFAMNVIFLTRVRPRFEPASTGRRLIADLVQGWQEVISRRWLALTLLAHSAWNLGLAAFLILGPLLIVRADGAAAWGLVSAGMAVGLLAGDAITLRWEPNRPVLIGNLALVLGAAPLLALAFHGPVVLIALAAAISNAGVAVLNTFWYSTLQRIIPANIMSRVMSYDWLLSFVSLPLGYSLTGYISRSAGSSATLIAVASIASIPAVLTVLIPTVRQLTKARIAAYSAVADELSSEAT